jgi:3-(3-hydroxy-phenyl)propionate hydroxylase
MRVEVDVVVVGGGPVGVTALALLGKVGLSAIGLEQASDIWPTARAVHFDGETFRNLQSLGIAEELSQVTIPMTSFHIENESREILLELPTGLLGSQGWYDANTFHQPDVERLLRSKLDEFPSVELRNGHKVSSVENVDGGVLVNVEPLEGSPYSLRARWVIAADGARSEVRQSLGIQRTKLGEDADWLVVDGHLSDSPGLKSNMIFLGHHTRPALWVRLPGSRVRMEFMLMPGDDPNEIITPEAIERISRGVLPVGKFKGERQATYTFRGRIADKWRDGNIFLAGDAAHLTPPLFGQGLCAGIRDVFNLVWKLDFVKRGLANESLLDTYESERKQHATEWVEQATNSAKFLQTTDEEIAAQRDSFLRANPGASAPVVPQIGPGLHDGTSDERAGKISPQPVLGDGVHLDDMVGVHFLVATDRETFEQLSPELKETLDKDAETVVLLDPAKISQLLDSVGGNSMIIRPDRYILGVAESSDELESLIKTIPSVDFHLRAQKGTSHVI